MFGCGHINHPGRDDNGANLTVFQNLLCHVLSSNVFKCLDTDILYRMCRKKTLTGTLTRSPKLATSTERRATSTDSVG